MNADLALEGGGIRGLAYAGALEVFEREGIVWKNVAGTSAGAIAAALVACGLRARDIVELLRRTDFRSFRDFSWNPFARWSHAGIYRGDAFERWLEGIVGDIPLCQTRVPLTVVTLDLRNQEVLTISRDTHPLLPVRRAVRMSMSIPHLFFRVDWDDRGTPRQCVDGGVCLNYPIDIFDAPGTPRWPTFGLALEEPPRACGPVRGHVTQARALVDAMRTASAKRLDAHNAYRSVQIPDGGISWLAFHLSREEQELLISNGRMAAEAFFYRWHAGGGFEGYCKRYR